MDEKLITVHEPGKASYTYWCGLGCWWVSIEGLGAFLHLTPSEMGVD